MSGKYIILEPGAGSIGRSVDGLSEGGRYDKQGNDRSRQGVFRKRFNEAHAGRR